MMPNLVKRMLLFCAVASVALLLPAAPALAGLDVVPSQHDFGEVEAGSTAERIAALPGFLTYCDDYRPHGGLDGDTPLARLSASTTS